MPLTRATVTSSSRLMLPAYVAFFAVVGGNWLATPRERLLASPGLAYADALLTIRAWGALFLGAAVVMAAALATRHRDAFRGALLFCFLTLLCWAAVMVFAAFRSETTPSGWAWPAFIATACLASYRSLTARET